MFYGMICLMHLNHCINFIFFCSRNNRPVDPSLTLRLASIPLNSELNLVYDANKNVTQPVNISVQYEDRQRRTGQFDPNKTLWDIIATLFQSDCPEVTNDDIVLSINFMNRQV